MAQLFGVCLLPATGEFAYDTLPAMGARWNPTGGAFGAGALETPAPINCYYARGGARTPPAIGPNRLVPSIAGGVEP